jgi:hypothetical protein
MGMQWHGTGRRERESELKEEEVAVTAERKTGKQ